MNDTELHVRRRWVLVVLCLSVLLVTIDDTIVKVALPTLGRELSATTGDLQWVVDACTLVSAGLLLVGGHLGDRFGRRPCPPARAGPVRAHVPRRGRGAGHDPADRGPRRDGGRGRPGPRGGQPSVLECH